MINELAHTQPYIVTFNNRETILNLLAADLIGCGMGDRSAKVPLVRHKGHTVSAGMGINLQTGTAQIFVTGGTVPHRITTYSVTFDARSEDALLARTAAKLNVIFEQMNLRPIDIVPL